ncbi:hypothetical protein MKW92_052323, partial [Papaver armeniacum]
MSWYRDPQLFIFGHTESSFSVYRITKGFSSSPIGTGDYKSEGELNFSTHLWLGKNKESDFNAFKASFKPESGIYKFINSHGLVIYWDNGNRIGVWSREEPNSPIWSLPGITQQKSSTEQALVEENTDLKAKIISLQDQVVNNK